MVFPRRACFLAGLCLIGLFVLTGLLGPGGWPFGIFVGALFWAGIVFLMRAVCWGPDWEWSTDPD